MKVEIVNSLSGKPGASFKIRFGRLTETPRFSLATALRLRTALDVAITNYYADRQVYNNRD